MWSTVLIIVENDTELFGFVSRQEGPLLNRNVTFLQSRTLQFLLSTSLCRLLA